MKNLTHLSLALTATLFAGTFALRANTYTKLDNTNSLTDPLSWSTGVVPGSGDIAQFNGTGVYAATNGWTLGAPVTWSGIQVLAATNTVSILNDGNTLTLGASGVDMSGASNNLYTYCPIYISTPQTWNVTNGRAFTVNGTLTGANGTNALDIVETNGGGVYFYSPISLRGNQTVTVGGGNVRLYGAISDGGSAYGVTKVGTGSLYYYGTNTYTGVTTVSAGNLTVQTNSSLPAASPVVVNTGGNLTVNIGGLINGPVHLFTNTAASSANATVSGTIAGNVTLDAGISNAVFSPQYPNTSAGVSAASGYVTVNGGGSLAAGGYITNNGVVNFSATSPSTPVTFGTFIMNNGLGGIFDANQAPKTFTFPNGSALNYFKCASNEVATFQVAGNGTCGIKFLGYNDPNTTGAQLWTYTNIFNGGTWTIGYIGQNNSACHYVGNATLTGGANMTITNNNGFAHGTWNITNGSLTFLAQLAEGHAAGNAGLNITAAANGSLTVSNGGFNLGLAAVNTGPENNSLNVSAGGSAFIKGTFQVGTTTANAYAETNAVNLSGGKLVVLGTLQSTTVGNLQDRVFNWTGGQLTAQTITTGVGFNDPASSINSSTVTNSAGILAPGDIGTPGKTTITGSYVQTSGGSLAVDINGTTQANTFTNLGAYYDTVSVSGSATVAGMITANLPGSYVPTSTLAFTVLTASGGLTATANSIGYNGLVPVTTNGVANGQYFQVLVAGNNLILTNYGVSVGTLAANFSPKNVVAVAPATANFTDLSTGVITNRYWDFGDGQTLNTTATSVSHTYASVGTYPVTLTVTTVGGATSKATGSVNATFAASSDTWVGGQNGNAWDLTTVNWLTNGVTGVYRDPDNVTFDDNGNAASAVNLTTVLQPTSVTFNNSTKPYTLSGNGYIAGSASVTLTGNSGVTLLTTNNYTGSTIIYGGFLQIGNGTADGGIDASTNITDNSSIIFNQSNNHNLAASLSGSGSLVKLGAGTLILGGDNSSSFSGPVTVAGGALTVASDATLGSQNGALTLSNATLQVNGGSTLFRNLTLSGTNNNLNVNGTITLQNAATGTATTTLAGGGTLQIDNGGTSVDLPGKIVLNGGSLTLDRSDSYTPAGTIASLSINSSLLNNGTLSGNTNTVNLAAGYNLFHHLGNYAASITILNSPANTTNVIGGTDTDVTGGGSFGLANANSSTELILNGGIFSVTNAPLYGTMGGGQCQGLLVLNNATLNSTFYGAASAADGGAHFLRGNVEVDGGTFHVSAWGLALCVANPNGAATQTFTVNSGSVLVDDSNTTPGATATTTFYGLGVGNHDFANNSGSYCGNALFAQYGGQVTLAGSTNNNLELGATYLSGNTKGGKTAQYLLSGGTLRIVGGINGGNVHIGGSSDGASSGTLILTNTGKLVAGSISGYGGAAGSQVFSFAGGTLVASNVNMNALSDSSIDPVGTLVNNGGTLAPGDIGTPGYTAIQGNYLQTNSAALAVDLNGTTAANALTNSGARYDTVAVSGTASLGGSLLVYTNGSVLAANSYTILTAASVTGSFLNVTNGRVSVANGNGSFDVVYNAGSVVLTNYSAGASGNVTPVPLTVSVGAGGSAVLSWPNGQGWQLQAQTNTLGIGLSNNWVNVNGATSPYTATPDTSKGAVFYQLYHP